MEGSACAWWGDGGKLIVKSKIRLRDVGIKIIQISLVKKFTICHFDDELGNATSISWVVTFFWLLIFSE